MSLSLSQLNTLEATRYLSGVALTISLYNHLLVLGEEVDLIWQQKLNALSMLVLVYSYVRESCMIYIAYVIGGMRPALTNTECSAFIKFMGFYGFLNVGAIQFLVLYRVYNVWGMRRNIRIALMCGYALAITSGAAFTVVAVVQISPRSIYDSPLNACLSSFKSDYLIGAWSTMLIYDIYVSALLIANSLDKPRRHDAEILTNLYRDGILVFLAFFVLQIAKLVPSIIGGATDMFLTPLVTWSLDGVLSLRLYLSVRNIEVNARKGLGWKSVVFEDDNQGQVPVLVFEEVEMKVI